MADMPVGSKGAWVPAMKEWSLEESFVQVAWVMRIRPVNIQISGFCFDFAARDSAAEMCVESHF